MRLSPGDIVEIETTAGLAYVQVTHMHSAYPEVVRVLKGLHRNRPVDLRGLAERPTAFLSMIPLASALEKQGLEGRKIGSEGIPAACRRFPTFKMPIRNKHGAVLYWWLWEGDGLRYDADVDDGAVADYPLREVPTLSSFLDHVVKAAA